MPLKLKVPAAAPRVVPRMAVLGVGGAGGNAVERMIEAGLEGVEYIVANSDAPALERSSRGRRVQLGRSTTRGLGAGSRPEVGRAAAEEALEEVKAALEGLSMVFIAAGMGGGTGTGASPVIARAAREMGILTVGVTTTPFAFEGPMRLRMAEAGLRALQPLVDTLLVIPNQNIFKVADRKTTFAEAFRLADGAMRNGVRTVADLILRPGTVNLDFSDVRAVVTGMGRAMMGAGEAEGDERAPSATRAAISNPLLEDLPLEEVRALLVNVAGGEDLTLHEVEGAVSCIGQHLDPAAEIIFGSTLDPALAGRLRVSVIATARGRAAAEAPPEAAPGPARLSLVSNRDAARSPGDSGRVDLGLVDLGPDDSGPDDPGPNDPGPDDPGSDDWGSDDWGPEDLSGAAREVTERPERESLSGPPPIEAPPIEAPPVEMPPVEMPPVAAPPFEPPPIEPPLAEAPEPGRATAPLIARLMDRWPDRSVEKFRRAERLYHGHGVPRDRALAFKLYRKAAKRGHAGAQNRVGWMLERGEGAGVDLGEAARWHRQAAEQGHLNAMNDLACLYRQGRGVPRDLGQALDWFRGAAAQYYPYAEYNLGQMHELGLGVAADLAEAVQWYRRAAGQGHELASRRLEDLGVAV